MHPTALSVLAGLALLGATVARAAPAPPPAAPADAAWREAFARPAAIPFPERNPPTPEKLALGRTLFFDATLSRSRTISCATCHNPSLGWGDGRARAVGEAGSEMPLRSPTLLNLAWQEPLGWTGRFPDLESVPFVPITAPLLMDLPEAELIARLAGAPAYRAAFAAAFPDGRAGRGAVEDALAVYMRSIVSADAPFDRWRDGDEAAVSASAKAGFALFNGRARCAECHAGFAFTDGSFHDVGVGQGDDVGRGRAFPGSPGLRYAFKTPTLRNVAERAPYLHDGSAPTLRAVIDLYDRGGIDRPSRSPEIRPLGLTETEKADLLAFLDTLTGAALATVPPDARAN